MHVDGERILIFGDSMSHPGADNGPTITDVTLKPILSSAPGEHLAQQLLGAGAQAVRINAKVGRSARSFFSEDTASLLASDQQFHPTKVIVWLGTNDIDRGVTPVALAQTSAAMVQIRDAYRKMGAEVLAIGPPTYMNARYNEAAPIMLNTMRGVFGTNATIDARPLTLATTRATDGVHFTSDAASAAGRQFAVALTTVPSALATATSNGTTIALGIIGTVGFLGLSWLALRAAHRLAKSPLASTSRRRTRAYA